MSSALCCEKAFLAIGAPAKAGDAARLISRQSSLSLLACMGAQRCEFPVMTSPSNGSASSRDLPAVFAPPSHRRLIMAPLFQLLTAQSQKAGVHPEGAGRRLGCQGQNFWLLRAGPHALLKHRKMLFQCHCLQHSQDGHVLTRKGLAGGLGARGDASGLLRPEAHASSGSAPPFIS